MELGAEATSAHPGPVLSVFIIERGWPPSFGAEA